MGNIIDTILSDPTFIWVAIILAILLVLGLVKKIFLNQMVVTDLVSCEFLMD